jgi:hypothetical protein
MTIPALIDKQDTFEIVRDQIATILVTEIASQRALATAGGKDSDLWKIRIYTERANAWEQFLEVPPADTSPICNIWYDQSSFPGDRGDTVNRQMSETTYNLDIFGYGIASDDGGTGHNPGDEEAAFAAQRALRLIRNILMAAEYTYLGLRKTVWQRWPQSIQTFQPELNEQAVQQVRGARVALRVSFNEFSPQVAAETLEYISTTIKRAEDGQILAQVDFDLTV